VASVLGAGLSWAALARFKVEVGTRCWIIVLLTAYLYDGVPPAGEDSEINERKMEFCGDVGQKSVLCAEEGSTNNDCCVPRLGLRMLVEFGASQCTLAGLSTHSARVLNIGLIGKMLCENVRHSRSASVECKRLAAGKLVMNHDRMVESMGLYRSGG
jgi:hypothetical protein